MLEKWGECEVGPSKRWEKSCHRPLIGLFDRLFRIQLTNSLSMCSCPRFYRIMPSCGCKSSKAFRSPQPNGQRLHKAKHRLTRFLIQRGSWRMETSSIMIWFRGGTKSEDVVFAFHENYEYVKPWLQKRIWLG